jgi:enterochelin esterase-like enzyme
LSDEEGYLSSNQAIADIIELKTRPDQFKFSIIKGGQHNEASWRKRLPTILKFLLKGL